MEELLEILEEINPDVDYETETNLIDGKVYDFDEITGELKEPVRKKAGSEETASRKASSMGRSSVKTADTASAAPWLLGQMASLAGLLALGGKRRRS